MNRIELLFRRHRVLWLLGALMLAGCGGGGSDTSTPPPPPPPPVVVDTSSKPPDGIATNTYSTYPFNATGGVQPYTWAINSGALPDGLALAADGTLSGTPTSVGTFTFTVKATDSAQSPGTGTQSFTVKISAPAPLLIDPGQTPPAGVHGTPYGFGFNAAGGYLPISWTVTAGALPPGLTFGVDGQLTGTPTTASSMPYAFTVTVTDSNKPTAGTNSADYSIAISEPPPPTIDSAAPPTAIVGSPYSFPFAAADGLAPLTWNPPTQPMGGLSVSPEGILSGTPTTPGVFPITLTVTDALKQTSPATPFTIRIAMARPAAGFIPAGKMNVARDAHTATLLPDGRVLIAGGGSLTAELFDPAAKTFTLVGTMMSSLAPRSATMLANSALPNYGKVLISGGNEVIAELFDSATGKFTATGSTLSKHVGQTATLLKNGKVLLAGGETAKAELFDPSSGTFTATGSMADSRTGHSAALLADGRVLITGGYQDVPPGTWPVSGCCSYDLSAEIYDPATDMFTPTTGSMSEGRFGHKSSVLADGTVLIAGTDSTAELFDPATGSFTSVGATSTGYGATLTLRNDGTVLVTGGHFYHSTSAANLYAPESGGFVPTGSLITPRDGHAATLLLDGSVLITGGTDHERSCGRGHCGGANTVLSTAELFK